MNKYLITYDLKNTPQSSYINLHNEIKEIGSAWWHYLESTWIIKTNLNVAGNISSRLVPHMKPGDRLFVVKIDPSDFQGLLPHDAWEWLNS